MLHSKVRRLLTVLALVLVLARRSRARRSRGSSARRAGAVAGLSLLDKLLDWLGLAGTATPASHPGRYEKSTTTVSDPATTGTNRATLNRGGMIDPNG